MKNKKGNFRYFIIIEALIIWFCQISFVNAAIIQGSNAWKDSRAYRPTPILFLHGFASGEPEGWDNASNALSGYFNKYKQPQSIISPSDFILFIPPSQYLERIRFFNPLDSQRQRLIDGNSSIDTYQTGDYYVSTGERNPGDSGWSDKVNSVIQPILTAYDTNKLIFVCHSMGGLAAREYLRCIGGNSIDKLVTIDTPHLGSELSNLANGLVRSQKIGWFLPMSGWISSSQIAAADSYLTTFSLIDMRGDAVKDMTPNSSFLQALNSSPQPPNTGYFAIVGTVWWDPRPGDGVVSVDSQLGTGVLSLQNLASIKAGHGQAPSVASQGNPSPLLELIDSTTPELDITEPDPNASPATELTISATHLKGKLTNEYLPADTHLKITVLREDDGTTEITGEDGSIKVEPSDLWSSTDPYSPRAEFDVPIMFKRSGTYTIKVTAVNPAKISSEEKSTRVKVTVNSKMVAFVCLKSPTMGVGIRPGIPAIDTTLCRFGTMSYRVIDEASESYEITYTPDNPNSSPVVQQIYFQGTQYTNDYHPYFTYYLGTTSDWAIAEKTVIADGVHTKEELIGTLAYYIFPPEAEWINWNPGRHSAGTYPAVTSFIYVDGVFRNGIPPKGAVVYGVGVYPKSYDYLAIPPEIQTFWDNRFYMAVGYMGSVP